MPLRVLCRAPGMPGRSTIYRWRREDPEFDRICASAQAEGHFGLVERVLAEVFELAERRGPRLARRWFNLRRQQLDTSKNPVPRPTGVAAVVDWRRAWP